MFAITNTGTGGSDGTAGVRFVPGVSVTVPETDPSVDVCVVLDLSPEISMLGCPLTVTLNVMDGTFASMYIIMYVCGNNQCG